MMIDQCPILPRSAHHPASCWRASHRLAHACVRSRLIAVPDDGVAQHLLQRVEPGIVEPPLRESVAEERLAHLFRAGCVDRAPAAVEGEASSIELESAMRKDAA